MSTIQGKYLEFSRKQRGELPETKGDEARVYREFDDCTRIEKFIELFNFRHFDRLLTFSQSDRKTYKKAIFDGVNVSVVLDMES